MECGAGLEVRRAPVCQRCGETLLSAAAPCLADHETVRGLAVVRAPLRYRGTGGRLVRRLKFRHDYVAGRWLARAMADAVRSWQRQHARRAVLVAVPLHPHKRRRRGIDQAAVLAGSVARRLGLRYRPRVLARVRETLPQGDPRVRSRVRNVAGAFVVRRPRSVRGLRVILVDDVITSGTTARECANALRAAGALTIALVTAAKA